MKKFFIILGIGAAVLAAALALILILSGRQGTPADDPDCRFPYSFTEKKDGILVTVKGAPDEGCSWTLTDGSLSAVSVGALASDGKKTTFLVSPVSFGAQSVTLAMLADGDDGARDCRYTITVDFLTAADGSLSVVGSKHREFEARRSFTSPDGLTYAYGFGPDGTLYVTVDTVPGEYWNAHPDRSGVVNTSFDGDPDETADTARFRMTPGTSGSVNVWLVNVETNAAVVVTVLNENGRLSVTGHTTSVYEEEVREQEKREHEVEDRFGEIRLPEGAVRTQCGLFSLRDSNGILWTPARVFFTLDGTEWEYDVGLFADRKTLYTWCGLTDDASSSASVAGSTAWTQEIDGVMTVVWAHEDGCSFALRASGVSVTDALALAERMDQINPLTAEGIIRLK